MNVLLIKPRMGRHPDRPLRRGYEFQAYEMACLAGVTPPEVQLTLHDERVEDFDDSGPWDAVGITVDTFTARRAYRLADGYRARGIPVILGGIHPSLVPDEAARHADCVVIGEAEETWPQVIRDLQAGRMQPRYAPAQPPSLVGLHPARAVFRGKRYLPRQFVEFGRGCRSACTYCSISAFYRHTYRHRPVAEVIEEIRALGVREICFTDDNIVADRDVAEEFLRALIPLKIRWSSQMSIKYADSPELLKLLRASGCTTLLIGLETLDHGNLAQVCKHMNIDAHEYAPRLANLRRHGICIWGSFMLGFGNDDAAAIAATQAFARREKMFLANFNMLMPIPGTVLYDDLKKRGRLLYDAWWLDENYRYGQGTFNPEKISAQELGELSYAMRRRNSSLACIFARACDLQANCRTPRAALAYVFTNLVFRREVHRKQWMTLGA